MRANTITGIILTGMLIGISSWAEVGDTIGITFDERTDSDIRDASGDLMNVFPGNPDAFSMSPMVTLGGVAHYNNPWEAIVAWNTTPTNGPGNETQNFGGDGTIAFDQVPALPAGEYHVHLSVNISKWNNGSPVGIQLGGTGVTEAGNELPGDMHFFYPPSNTGDDTVFAQIAGPHLGPGTAYLVDSNGVPFELFTSGGPLMVPMGSNTNIFNDGNSFPTSLLLSPNNQLVLTLRDGAAVAFAHLRGFSMSLTQVAEFVAETTNVTLPTTRVEFDTNAALSYALQCTTDPAGGTWDNTGAVADGNGSSMYLFDPVGADETKIYRVVQHKN